MKSDYPDEPEDLARLLDELARSDVRADFRARLRDDFVHGRLPDAFEPDAALSRALDAWHVPPPGARLKAVERDAFVNAGLVDAGQNVSQDARRPAVGRRLLIAGGLAAAASIVSIAWPRGPHWEVVPGSYTAAGLTVDDVSLEGLDHSEVSALLRGARVVETADSTLKIQLGQRFLLELASESRLEIPADISGDSLMLGAERGSFRVATGPEFTGMLLGLETPQLEAQVVGTIFGVDVYDSGTCVCCIDGRVQVEPKLGDSSPEVTRRDRATFITTEGVCSEMPVVKDHEKPLRLLVPYWN